MNIWGYPDNSNAKIDQKHYSPDELRHLTINSTFVKTRYYESDKLTQKNCLSQNVQNIWRSHKVYRENHGKLVIENNCWRKKLNWSEIYRGIFQEDVSLPSLFVIVIMVSITYLGNTQADTNFQNCKINHLMYMEVIKLLAKNEKEFGNSITDNVTIESGYWKGICIKKCASFTMRSGKRYITERIERPKPRKKSGSSEKWKPTITWIYWKLTPSNKWRWKKIF